MRTEKKFIFLYIRKFINSFLSPKFLTNIFHNKYKINTKKPSGVVKFYHKVASRLWFIPNMYTSFSWAHNEENGHHGFRTFMQIDDRAKFFLSRLNNLIESKDDSILDLGCNIGRFLNVLAHNGCTNLTGVDINNLAIEKSYVVYPELASVSNMINSTFQEFLLNSDKDAFDIFFSYGATIELVHPTFPLVKHISRISKTYVCVFISEYQLYTRLWEFEFRKYNFYLLSKEPYCDPNLNSDCSQSVLYIFKKRV